MHATDHFDDRGRHLKTQAAAERRTLQEVTNDALRRGLARPKREPFKLRLAGWSAEQEPGVDITDRDKLFDLMDGR
jgi:hypothetical protein